MTEVVLLGGLGFIGSHISRVLADAGYTVSVFDRPKPFPAHIHDLTGRMTHIAGDATDPDAVIDAIRTAHTVVDLVHSTVPASSMQDPAADIVQNVAAAVGWLRRLDETQVRRIVYVSSGGTVYGKPVQTPIPETHPTDPISSYGITKLALEKYVMLYAHLHGLKCQILRPANVYGVGQKLHIAQGVVGVMIHRALCGQPFELWGDGLTVRDYIYVTDMARAVESALAYDGDEQVFNIGTGAGHSVLDVIETVRGALGRDFEIFQKPAGGFSVPVNVLDSSRLQQATGWQPTVSFTDGIAQTVAWLQQTTG